MKSGQKLGKIDAEKSLASLAEMDTSTRMKSEVFYVRFSIKLVFLHQVIILFY